jgi:exo-beta-1,3-glucanase (GH17 family)
MNKERIQEIIELAKQYEPIVSSISIGNEIRSEWSNRRLPVKRMVEIVNTIKSNTTIPVTYCEEYQVWIQELAPVAKVVDFISLHTYPAWQGNTIDIALDTAIKNYNQVQQAFPDTPCIITETGWPTSTHGSKIKKENATIENQHIYNKQISDWAKQNNVLVYLFEAFDEPWKGGDHPDEPEKHWGIYNVDRTRK